MQRQRQLRNLNPEQREHNLNWSVRVKLRHVCVCVCVCVCARYTTHCSVRVKLRVCVPICETQLHSSVRVKLFHVCVLSCDTELRVKLHRVCVTVWYDSGNEDKSMAPNISRKPNLREPQFRSKRESLSRLRFSLFINTRPVANGE